MALLSALDWIWIWMPTPVQSAKSVFPPIAPRFQLPAHEFALIWFRFNVCCCPATSLRQRAHWRADDAAETLGEWALKGRLGQLCLLVSVELLRGKVSRSVRWCFLLTTTHQHLPVVYFGSSNAISIAQFAFCGLTLQERQAGIRKWSFGHYLQMLCNRVTERKEKKKSGSYLSVD